ncbi:ABC transporter ATP-binding protein [Slackia exigua]|uniref:ABC transporter ATP-binding protein n=1 Tax=Slackia exigua TaxID=84109 RepID=UPI003B9E13CD
MSFNEAAIAVPEEFVVPSAVRDEDSAADVAIQFEHVTKMYKLFSSDKARFAATFSKRIPYKEILANKDLSFTIHRGEAVAFLGSNGAGKSTALKIITGVAYPTRGRVTVHGRVSALLELSAGFDYQLSGRENIALRGQLWGLSNQDLRDLEPKIIEFAELGDYIDQPMRTYSSGMKARLGFAFASSIAPDILVVDEALSVGDRRFQRKCLARVREIISDSRVTVLFVTHSSSSAKEFCKRGIVLEQGSNIFEGDIKAAVEFYEKRN